VFAINVSNVPRTGNMFSAYSGQVTSVGGVGKVTYSCVPSIKSVLGQGTSLNSDTGALSTDELWVAGDFGPFSFVATDSVGNVVVSGPVYFTIGNSLGGLVTTHFAETYQCESGVFCTIKQQVATSGFAWSFLSLTGTLPTGMGFDKANGIISGTPTSSPGDFVVTVSMAVGTLRPDNQFTVRVVAPMRPVASFLQPTCDLGFPFSSRLEWTGGPVIDTISVSPTPSVKVSLVLGNLPPGVRFAFPATQVGSYQRPQIVGSPTRLGTFSVSLIVTNIIGGSFTVTYSVEVVPPASIVTANVSMVGEVGIPYSSVLSQAGGRAPKYWFFPGGVLGNVSASACQTLPYGLTVVNPPQGPPVLFGVPSANGSFPLTLFTQPYFVPPNSPDPMVLGAAQGSQELKLTIYSRLQLPPVSELTVEAESPFVTSIPTSGGVPGTFQFFVIGTLPAGVSLNTMTGDLQGTLSQIGSHAFTLGVADALGAHATTPVNLRVASNAPSSLSTGAIIGIALGGAAAISVAVVCAILAYRKWNSSRANLRSKDEIGVAYQQMNTNFESKYSFDVAIPPTRPRLLVERWRSFIFRFRWQTSINHPCFGKGTHFQCYPLHIHPK
jgi:hypothetical protein